MKLAEIRDLIRAEAGLQGLDEYLALIDAILNQELQAATGKAKYQELWKTVTLTATSDAQNTFDLPEDFQLLASANFHESGMFPEVGVELHLGKMSQVQRQIEGSPRFHVIQAGQIIFYPYAGIVLDDYIILEYYYRPVLILDDDEFPIPSLEKSIQQLVMARLLRQVDTKRAQMAKLEGNQGFLESRAENAANS